MKLLQANIQRLQAQMNDTAQPLLIRLEQHRDGSVGCSPPSDFSAGMSYKTPASMTSPDSGDSAATTTLPIMTTHSKYGQPFTEVHAVLCAEPGQQDHELQHQLNCMAIKRDELQQQLDNLRCASDSYQTATLILHDIENISAAIISSSTPAKSASNLHSLKCMTSEGAVIATIAEFACTGTKTSSFRPEVVELSSSIDLRSPSAYKALRSGLRSLPSQSTLHRHEDIGEGSSGLERFNFDSLLLAAEAAGVDLRKTPLIMSFDELNDAEAADINHKTGIIEGFRDDVNFLSAYTTAEVQQHDSVHDPDYVVLANATGDNILQIMVCTPDRKFHYPMGYYVTR